MKRAGSWSLLVLPLLTSSATPMSAQQSSGTAGMAGDTLTIPEAHPAAESCPVSILAQHGSGGSGTFLLSSTRQQKVSQELHLTLSNGKAVQVVGVRLTVLGTSTKSGMVQTNAEVIGVSGKTKTMDLTLAVNPKDEAAIDLSLPGFTSVQRVDLDSVTYADGTSWQASNAGTCRFAPEGLMLISSR